MTKDVKKTDRAIKMPFNDLMPKTGTLHIGTVTLSSGKPGPVYTLKKGVLVPA